MNAKKEIERHRLPCGPLTIAIDGVCRKRLRDSFDALLDKVTTETHPEGRDPEAEDLNDEHEMQEEAKKTREEMERQLANDKNIINNEVDAITSHETLEDKKEKMIEEGKMKAEVKHEIQKHAEKLMGNSKMLQDTSGKIKKR